MCISVALKKVERIWKGVNSSSDNWNPIKKYLRLRLQLEK